MLYLGYFAGTRPTYLPDDDWSQQVSFWSASTRSRCVTSNDKQTKLWIYVEESCRSTGGHPRSEDGISRTITGMEHNI